MHGCRVHEEAMPGGGLFVPVVFAVPCRLKLGRPPAAGPAAAAGGLTTGPGGAAPAPALARNERLAPGNTTRSSLMMPRLTGGLARRRFPDTLSRPPSSRP